MPHAVAAAGLLLLEHFLAYKKLDRTQALALGTGTLTAAFAAWCWQNRQVEALAAWGTIAGLGGAAIIVAYWVRGEIAAIDEVAFVTGRLAERGGVNANPQS